MSNAYRSDQQTYGDVVLARLTGQKIPTSLRPSLVTFRSEHGKLTVATIQVDKARAQRDNALESLSLADANLDAQLFVFRAKMAGAELGTRTNAFHGFSKYSPSRLTELACADEVTEVLSLTRNVKKAKPPPDVVKAANACEKLAAKVADAIKALNRPKVQFLKAETARGELLAGWQKAFERFKVNAKAAWIDDPGMYEAIFAPLSKVDAPVHKRPKKPSATVTPVVSGTVVSGATATTAPPAASPGTVGLGGGGVPKPE